MKLEICTLRKLDIIIRIHFYKGLERIKNEFKLKELLLIKFV